MCQPRYASPHIVDKHLLLVPHPSTMVFSSFFVVMPFTQAGYGMCGFETFIFGLELPTFLARCLFMDYCAAHDNAALRFLREHVFCETMIFYIEVNVCRILAGRIVIGDKDLLVGAKEMRGK